MRPLPVFTPTWQPAPPNLAIAPGELHIWQASLNPPDAVLAALATTLSEAELAKANRLHQAPHRRAAIASRGILRSLLGGYLHQAPQALRFDYTPQGKPSLSPPLQAAPLEFNLSHSDQVALLAIRLQDGIGIDVEAQRPLPLLPNLLQRYFSPQEQAAIAAADQPEHEFFYYWTAKEALTKATGYGLTDLARVALHLSETVVQVQYSRETPSPEPWQVRCFSPRPGYAAAVAYRAPTPLICRYFTWHDNISQSSAAPVIPYNP